MGLYKENKIKNFFKNKTIWIVLGIVVAIGIIGYFSTFINWASVFEKENIKIKFIGSPLDLSKKENIIMEITVFNNTEKDLENLMVKIKDVEETFVIYCPDSKEEDKTRVDISKIATGNQRVVTCDVRYDKAKDFFQGTYSFDVEYFIDDFIYVKRVNLEVKR